MHPAGNPAGEGSMVQGRPVARHAASPVDRRPTGCEIGYYEWGASQTANRPAALAKTGVAAEAPADVRVGAAAVVIDVPILKPRQRLWCRPKCWRCVFGDDEGIVAGTQVELEALIPIAQAIQQAEENALARIANERACSA